MIIRMQRNTPNSHMICIHTYSYRIAFTYTDDSQSKNTGCVLFGYDFSWMFKAARQYLKRAAKFFTNIICFRSEKIDLAECGEYFMDFFILFLILDVSMSLLTSLPNLNSVENLFFFRGRHEFSPRILTHCIHPSAPHCTLVNATIV